MEGKNLSGKYQIIRKVASGGMGVIYEALHAELQRTVALKILHSRFSEDQDFIERFKREARAMARLDQKNIIRVFDVLEEKQTHFIVMEFFPGKNVHEILKEKKRLSQKAVLSIAYQTAKALGYAHQNGIIHRDIKPANILMNSQGLVKLADFGIAAASDETSLTATNHIVGTPDYMSPEQARGETLDGASDLYSLGMVMYEMLTGHTGYESWSNTAILKKLIYEDTEHTLAFQKDISPSLKNLIRNLLTKNKSNRISNTTAFLHEIKTIRSELKQNEGHITTPKAVQAETPLQKEPPTHAPKNSDHPLKPSSSSPKPLKPTLPAQQPVRKRKKRVLAVAVVLLAFFTSLGFYLLTKDRVPGFPSGEIQDILLEISHLKDQLAHNKKESERVQAQHWAKTDLAQAEAMGKKAGAQLETANRLIIQKNYMEAGDALKIALKFYEQTDSLISQAIKTAQGKIIQHEQQKSNRAREAQKKAAEEVQRLKNEIKKTRENNKEQQMHAQNRSQEAASRPVSTPKRRFRARPAPPDPSLRPRPDINPSKAEAEQLDALGAILSQLIEAYENKNLHAIQNLSAPSRGRVSFLKHLFKNYQKIAVSITDLSVVGNKAEAVISITELTSQTGKTVLPSERWKTAKLTIHQKNGDWDKAVW